MKLSDFDLEKFNITLIRDGVFESLGSFTRDKEKMLVFIEEEKYLTNILNNSKKYSSVICSPEIYPKIPSNIGFGITDDPAYSFYLLHNYLANSVSSYHILPKTYISDSASIHSTAFIDTNVIISKGCIIHPHAIILRGTILDEDVVIGPGCVIGGEGFRFFKRNLEMMPITHVGGVKLKKGVQIQSNSCVDKAVYADYTVIGEDTKVDNLVHIAHNVKIGKRCSIVASSIIGGSTIIGDDVWIGPNASISDNLIIGDAARISLGSVVTKNVPDRTTVTGNFAIEHSKFLQFIKTIR